MQSVLDHLREVRERLSHARKATLDSKLNIFRLVSRRNSLLLVLRKLSAIGAVHQTQTTLQQLLAGGDYTAALDLIDAAQELLATELVGVHSLR